MKEIAFFTEAEAQEIMGAIKEAEARTSGEIRVFIEAILISENAILRATEVFNQLNMTQTAERNGVLFYIAHQSHKFAILGDKSINELVPDHFWLDIRDEMKRYFKNGRFKDGLITGINRSGIMLANFFPRKHDDINELPDDLVYG